MKTIYHVETGATRSVDSVDARELVETGRWSESPSVSPPLTDTKGAVPGDGDTAPCLPPVSPAGDVPPVRRPGADMTVIELRAALKEKGVTFMSVAPKAELVALYDGLL